ncbi:MAG: hypothetical protein L0229_00125 [Blastocatellia bacterium]|nr:hypothetical protein [Blastocatellia bacterium]
MNDELSYQPSAISYQLRTISKPSLTVEGRAFYRATEPQITQISRIDRRKKSVFVEGSAFHCVICG